MRLGVVVRKVEDLELYEGGGKLSHPGQQISQKQRAGSRLFKYCARTLAALYNAGMLNRIWLRIIQ